MKLIRGLKKSIKRSRQIKHHQHANVSKLSGVTKLQLFRLLDLEAFQALSQTCSTLHSFWRALDESVVKEKVRDRVPWIVTNESETYL